MTILFRSLLTDAGIEVVRLPYRSPNLNAFCERCVRSIKEECLDRFVPLGERHLRNALDEYMEHYHLERPHQGMGNQLIDGYATTLRPDTVHCRERLGGLLKHYEYRRAA